MERMTRSRPFSSGPIDRTDDDLHAPPLEPPVLRAARLRARPRVRVPPRHRRDPGRPAPRAAGSARADRNATGGATSAVASSWLWPFSGHATMPGRGLRVAFNDEGQPAGLSDETF